MAERLKRLHRVNVALLRLGHHVARVAALCAGEALEAALLVEQTVELVEGVALLAEEEQNAWIDRSGTRAHDKPVKRREAHRCVDALAVLHCGKRRSVAEMACDEIDLLQRLLQPRRSGLRDELVRSAVETVLADAELLRHLARQRILIGASGHGLVEGGVEHAHVGNALGRLLASLDALKVRRVVERRKRHAFANERLRGGGDLRGSGELVATMHHAVADRVDLGEALHDPA